MSPSQSNRVAFLGLISKHAGHNYGGTAVSLVRRANCLAAQGVKVLILTASRDPLEQMPEILSDQVEVHEICNWNKMRATLDSWFALRQRNIEKLVAIDTRAIKVALNLKRISLGKVLVWALLTNHANLKVRSQPFRKIRDQRFLTEMIGKAESVITVSEGLRRSLIAKTAASEHRVKTIYNPAPSLRFYGHHGENSNLIEDFSGHTIVSAGRLAPEKDFHTLIRAMPLVEEQSGPCRLIILGEGPLRSSLLESAASLGISKRVMLPGFTRRPYDYFFGADVFALTSTHEGFGNVLIEAMACGLPVVSTDCPSGPREILDHGRYGELVRVHDHKNLAEGIIRQIKNPTPKAHLAERAGHFSPETIARVLLEELRMGRNSQAHRRQ